LDRRKTIILDEAETTLRFIAMNSDKVHIAIAGAGIAVCDRYMPALKMLY
jgi:hypothetical protein